MFVFGRFADALSATMRGSFHLVILPRKMSARTSGLNFSSGLPGQIVGEDHGACHHGNMEQRRGHRREVGVVQEGVARTEVDGLALDLRDAASGSNGLVVDLDAELLGVLVESLGIKGAGNVAPAPVSSTAWPKPRPAATVRISAATAIR